MAAGTAAVAVGEPHRLAVSGDRSKVLVPVASNGSTARWYDAATHGFTPVVTVASYAFYGAAVDQTGDRVFGGRRVLDGDLATVGAINTPQPLPYLAGISPDGSLGYRVEGTDVRVLDLDSQVALRSVATGDLGAKQDGRNGGAFAVSADGRTVAVITAGGLSILRDP